MGRQGDGEPTKSEGQHPHAANDTQTVTMTQQGYSEWLNEALPTSIFER
jgi:hypothetical protein